MKICMKCKKGIDEKENYYAFVEHNKKKIVHTDYAHRKCWDDFLGKLSSLGTAQDFLSRINLGPLESLGLLKPKEVVIN